MYSEGEEEAARCSARSMIDAGMKCTDCSPAERTAVHT